VGVSACISGHFTGQRWNGTRFDYQPGSMAGRRKCAPGMLQSRVPNRGPTEGVSA